MKRQFENIEEYLEYVGQCRKGSFGPRFRSQFRDSKGTAELAMLAAPSEDEFQQFSNAVKVMTEAEKAEPEKLSDGQIADIAQSSGATVGVVGIFINGFVLSRKRTAQ
ncbi:MAG: hypothetical protein JEZ07_04585 [Phycisphaerae bacterium]|nr:hypothetical protein [Phycisphaerae bacterium]